MICKTIKNGCTKLVQQTASWLSSDRTHLDGERRVQEETPLCPRLPLTAMGIGVEERDLGFAVTAVRFLPTRAIVAGKLITIFNIKKSKNINEISVKTKHRLLCMRSINSSE